MCLEQRIIIISEDHVTLKTGINDAENVITAINDVLRYTTILFKIVYV